MKTSASRVVVIVSAVALVLAACGEAGTDGAGSDELQPPVPIEFTGGGSAAAASDDRVAADAEMTAADPAGAWAPYFAGYEFSVADDFPALPTASTGYQFPSGAGVEVAEVQRIAAALGVEGEPVEGAGANVDGTLWRVGPDDGTAASLTVSADAMLSWYYSAPWARTTAAGGVTETCEAVAVPEEPDAAPTSRVPVSAVEPDGGTDANTEIVTREECTIETPEPPDGILTADEAEVRATALLEALGEDPSQFHFDTYADEWAASVSAGQRLDGQTFPVMWSFGFGENGTLQYANGILADAVATGPYPLIGLDEALERLEDQSGVWGGGIALDVARSSDPTGARGAAEADAGVGVAEPPVTEAPVVAPDGAPATAVPDTTVPASTVPGEAPPAETVPVDPVPETVPVDPVPVDPVPESTAPAEPVPATEPELVELVDVKADLWWVWDADNTVWLLPAYTFSDAEGRAFTVAAVTDEYLIVVEPEILPEPEPAVDPPVDGGGSDGAIGRGGVDEQADPTVVDASLGLPLDEFTKAAEQLGLTVRVAREDGEDLALTMDYLPNRLNVAVEDGVVTEVVSVG